MAKMVIRATGGARGHGDFGMDITRSILGFRSSFDFCWIENRKGYRLRFSNEKIVQNLIFFPKNLTTDGTHTARHDVAAYGPLGAVGKTRNFHVSLCDISPNITLLETISQPFSTKLGA